MMPPDTNAAPAVATPPIHLVDSHCHLDFPELSADLAGILARAEAAGVQTMLTIGTNPAEWESNRRLAARYPQIYYSAGVHPDEVAAVGLVGVDRLIALAQDPRMVGFGETGLDYYRGADSAALQAQSFADHLAAAAATNLPVIVHTRAAEQDTVSQLQAAKQRFPNLRGVIHCFTGSAWLAEQVLPMDFMISIAGVVTFKNAEPLRQVVRDIVPLDKLLVETDAPFLAPVPHRGKANEPGFVRHTAEMVAQLKGCSLAEVATTTTANFHRLFTRTSAGG